jgi:hypothetical protein
MAELKTRGRIVDETSSFETMSSTVPNRSRYFNRKSPAVVGIKLGKEVPHSDGEELAMSIKIRSKMGRLALLAAVVAPISACDGEHTSVETIALTTVARTQVSKWRIPLDVETPITMKVDPNGICTLHSQTPDAHSGTAEVSADSEGTVQFYSRPTAADLDVTTNLLLDCADEAGKVKSYPLEITGATSDLTSALAVDPRPPGINRPPINGDPGRYSDAELVSAGYPPRPDSHGSPAAYAHWLKVVSTPAVAVSGRPIERKKTFNAQTSDIWSGGVIDQPGAIYDLVSGVINVPSATYADCPASDCFGSLWVGLDGSPFQSADGRGSPDVLQDGIVIQAINVHSFHGTFYGSWVEWFPGNEVTIGVAVHPGDQLFAEAWIGDSTGAITASGSYGWFYMYNETTTAYYQGNLAEPSGIKFVGNDAEWIMERQNTNGTHWPLVHFGNASISQLFARNGTDFTTQHDFSTDLSYDIWMTDHYVPSTILDNGIDNRANTVNFFWRAFGGPF